MRERPILFSGSMVRAILDGRKTQTRRGVKITHRTPGLAACLMPPAGLSPRPRVAAELCPYGQPGDDRLWVRETWQHEAFPFGPYRPGAHVYYRADYLDDPHGPDGEMSQEGKYRSWRPSIHMPRAASRILLEITAVRVERLQSISEADAQAEGTLGGHGAIPGYPYNATPVEHFRHVWDSINGPGSWAVNPWVWCISFRRTDHA